MGRGTFQFPLDEFIPVVLRFSVHQRHLEGLLKHRLLGPTPEFLTQNVWDRAQERAFLTSSQVILMLADGLRTAFSETLVYTNSYIENYIMFL